MAETVDAGADVLIGIDRNDVDNTSPITINKNLFTQRLPCNRKIFEGIRPLPASEIRKQKEAMLASYLKHREMASMYLFSNQSSN